MRWKGLICFGLAAAGLVLPSLAGEIPWLEDPKGALAAARRDSKPVLVDIWAVWCAPCKQMEKTTYRNEEVLKAAEAFVALKVDSDQQKAFVQRYEIGPLPVLLFLDGEGREIGRKTGFIEPPELLGLMRAVSTGFPQYQKALGAGKDPAALEIVGRYFLSAGNPTAAVDFLKKALKSSSADENQKASLHLALAQAQLGSGDAKAAATAFTKLAEGGAERETRARALAGLWRAEQARERENEANQALARLRQEFPDLAPALEK